MLCWYSCFTHSLEVDALNESQRLEVLNRCIYGVKKDLTTPKTTSSIEADKAALESAAKQSVGMQHRGLNFLAAQMAITATMRESDQHPAASNGKSGTPKIEIDESDMIASLNVCRKRQTTKMGTPEIPKVSWDVCIVCLASF